MTRRFAPRTLTLSLAAVACLGLAGMAQAQSLDSLKGMVGGGGSDSGGGVASALGLGSSGSSSLGNATGIVSYCIKNNYLGGGDASSMKDKLMGKLTGGGKEAEAEKNTDYASGLKGILNTGEGKSVDLSSLGGGMKEKVPKQVCDKVLSQAKSFL